MRFKVISGVALIAVSAGVALARHRNTGLQSRDPAIKVVINQPPAKDGVSPIEIIQPIVVSSAPNKLDDFTYTLRNNSNKPIKAVAVVRTISYEEGGKVHADSVKGMREGARRYKSWLAQEYSRAGKSLATILPTIPSQRHSRILQTRFLSNDRC